MPNQIQAISMLASGLSDNETARRLNLNRKTINRWRLFDPVFGSRLNRARLALWANTLDGLRASLPRCVEVLTAALASDNPAAQQRAAIHLLRVAGTARLAPKVGPDNVRSILTERAQMHRKEDWLPSQLKDMVAPDQSELDDLHAFLTNYLAEEDASDPDLGPTALTVLPVSPGNPGEAGGTPPGEGSPLTPPARIPPSDAATSVADSPGDLPNPT